MVAFANVREWSLQFLPPKARYYQMFFSLTLLLTSSGHPLGAGQSTMSAEAVFRAWSEKERGIRTVKIAWTDRMTIPKGAIMDARFPKSLNPNGLIVPADDHTHEESSDLIIDRHRWRLEHDGFSIDSKTGVLVKQKTTLVSKDGQLQAYMPNGVYDYPMGNINKITNHDIPKGISMQPVFLLFRAWLVELIHPQDFVVMGRAMIGESDCVQLQTKYETPKGGRWCIWVDPKRDYSVLRYTWSKEGQTMLKVDFHYRHDENDGWVPKQWSVVDTCPDGHLEQSVDATVLECAINKPVDGDTFEFDFPPGTWVRDFTRPSETGDTTQYIVREAGSKRFITRADRGATYEQLLRSEPLGARRFSLMWIFFICSLLITITLLRAMLRRMVRRKF